MLQTSSRQTQRPSWMLHSCPRCKLGDLFSDYPEETDYHCLQCGHVVPIGKSSQLKTMINTSQVKVI